MTSGGGRLGVLAVRPLTRIQAAGDDDRVTNPLPGVLEVRRDDLAQARVVEEPPAVLADGEALLAVERFGLTAGCRSRRRRMTPASSCCGRCSCSASR